MAKNELKPSKIFDTLRGTGRHKVETPAWISWSSLEDYRQRHAGQRFILANITLYQYRRKEPIVNLWEDLPLDHDHLLQSLRLLLKVANEFTGVVAVRADFPNGEVNPVRLSCMDDVDVEC